MVATKKNFQSPKAYGEIVPELEGNWASAETKAAWIAGGTALYIVGIQGPKPSKLGSMQWIVSVVLEDGFDDEPTLIGLSAGNRDADMLALREATDGDGVVGPVRLTTVPTSNGQAFQKFVSLN